MIITITEKKSNLIPLLLGVSLVCVMFSFFLSSLFLGISLFLSIFIFDSKKFTRKNVLIWLLVSMPFFLALFSLFFSYNLPVAFDTLVERLPIFLIPYIAILTKGFGKKGFFLFFLIFALGCFAVNLYGLINGIFFYLRTGSFFEPNSLFYIYPIQHVYLAAYNVFILIASIFLYSVVSKKSKILILLINFVNVTSFFLLSSKMALVILLLCLLLILFSKFSIKKAALIIVVLSVVIYIIFVLFTPFLMRIVDLFSGIDPRFVIWKCTWEQISSMNFLDFIPIGDYQSQLDYCYYKKTNKFSLEKYNTHNQYLEFWLTNGIMGLLVYLISLFSLFIFAVRTKKIIMIYFLIIILLFSFTETIFQRQYGIMFYSVLASLSVFSNTNKGEII